MIEEIILKYLLKSMSVPVYMEIPESPPEKFVILEKTGGGSANYICSATLAIKSYGKTLYEAAELNEQVKIVMEDITDLNEIVSVKLNNDYNFTDTSSKEYRYQAVYDIIHY